MVGHLRRLAWELRPLGRGLGMQFRQMFSPRRFQSFSLNCSVAPNGLPISGRTRLNSLRAQREPCILEPV